MPKLNVVGVLESKGVYEGYPYDNVLLHCAKEIVEGKGYGSFTEVVKVKRNLFSNVVLANLEVLVGKKVSVAYDKAGKVEEVEVL